MTTKSKWPVEELFQEFPRGIALLDLVDPRDTSTWRLQRINRLASTIVPSSIDTFLSCELLGLGGSRDLPAFYQKIIRTGCPCTLGLIRPLPRKSAPSIGIGLEGRSAAHGGSAARNQRLYLVSAFPAGGRRIGILFEDADSYLAGRSARIAAERQLQRTCEFVGAILWRAEPDTLEFTYVSPHAQSVLGYWPERWIGQTNFWRTHLHPDDRDSVAAACREIASEGMRRDFEFRMMNSLNEVRWFHAAAELVEVPGHKPELSGVMNDITALKNAEERVRALSLRLMTIQDDERRHISRELHDSLGQYLTSMKINSDILKRESSALDEQHRALLADNAETLDKCVREIRAVSYLLHPPLLDELGLVAALRWYTAGFTEHTGIAVNLDISPQFSRLPAAMELGLFRILQESLTNVQRHSHSNAVWISVSEQAHRVAVRIADRGVGIPPEIVERIQEGKSIEGVGLRGMYERMRELGGQIEIQTSSTGTAVCATLPLKPVAAAQTGGERKARAAGKPLHRAETSDVHIEAAPGEADRKKAQSGEETERQVKRKMVIGRRALRRPT